jgi:transcription-repair coupling factor (superfamily II helicase)
MSKQRYLASAGALFEEGVAWAGLTGDALAYVLSEVLGDGPGLVVVDEADAAERLTRALRFFHLEPSRVEVFPADDVRFYDGFSPSPEPVSQRIRVLHRIRRGDPILVVASARALMQRVPDDATLRKGTLELKPEQIHDRDEVARALSDSGYLAVGHVQGPGSYAVRGDVLDVWSAGLTAPRRIDFFDDEIEAIRALDPRTQRAKKAARRALILPAREERIDEAALRRAQEVLGKQVSEQDRGLALRRRQIEELRAGIRFSAIEDLLPALVPTQAPLDALQRGRVFVVQPSSVRASLRDAWETAERRWGELDDDERPLVPPTMRFESVSAVLDRLEDAHPVYEMAAAAEAARFDAGPVEGYAVRGSELGPVVNRIRKLADNDGKVALVARTAKRADTLEQLLEPHGLTLVGRTHPEDLREGEVTLLIGDLPRGFVSKDSKLAFIPASALFGGRSAAKQRAHELFDVSVGSVAELKEGDVVVHRLHGIGRYLGLQRLDVQGHAQDFVRLEYRGGDLMYLPATSLAELSRYTAATRGVEPRLDRLGGATWNNRKAKVRDSLLQRAQELLDLAARREIAERPPMPPPGQLYRAFEARFPYTETPDQAQAIVDIQADLSGDVPMDRLVCGDVGFGKTEVAMRATMRVVENGHQVAILCPTTVLAFQHLRTFRERFETLPVRVEMLSRFSTPKEEREVLAGIKSGAVDIVVGTHRLLGRGVSFTDLRLVVVDEEHRFGVRQKARLKKMRTEVDILSMSATPIPRTLQMALSGVRQMSVMATPPTDRLAVRTTVARLGRARVRDTILVELERGGQCYFVHNRIESIERMRTRLEEWVPEARFEVAHGKMSGEQLEKILLGFIRREFDVLLCTSIVESGVDLPNVNTMLVNRADLFGLAQLYQLRGRVGRSAIRGNCVLLTPESTNRDARRRLQVLVDNTRLGSGFTIASADLELRGGGNLLGEAQSGNIDAVGFEVWVELLQQAVASARGRADQLRIEPEVEVPVDAFIPESLVPDMNERLGWYRRFSDVARPDDVEAVMDDFQGLVGELPVEVRRFAGLVRTKLLCRELGIVRASWHKVRASFELHESSPLTDAVLESVRNEHPKRFSITTKAGTVTFVARFTPKESRKPFRYLRWVLARFESTVRELS